MLRGEPKLSGFFGRHAGLYGSYAGFFGRLANQGALKSAMLSENSSHT